MDSSQIHVKAIFLVSPYEKISLKILGSTVESSLVKNF